MVRLLTSLPSAKYLISMVLGILSHNFIFIHGEWHIRAPLVLKRHVTVFVLAVMVEAASGSGKVSDALRTTSMATSVYTLALFASMAVYRKFFHRLRNFPGPSMAGSTKSWHVYHCANSRNHLLLDRMHQTYGRFVRTGPEEVTVFDPEVLPAVDGPGNACTKAVWYGLLLRELAVNTTRSKPQHDQRRRTWDHGSTTKALASYEELMMIYGDLLEHASHSWLRIISLSMFLLDSTGIPSMLWENSHSRDLLGCWNQRDGTMLW